MTRFWSSTKPGNGWPIQRVLATTPHVAIVSAATTMAIAPARVAVEALGVVGKCSATASPDTRAPERAQAAALERRGEGDDLSVPARRDQAVGPDRCGGTQDAAEREGVSQPRVR